MSERGQWSPNDCFSCHEAGYECSPGKSAPIVTCPGEVCASCDYAAGAIEETA